MYRVSQNWHYFDKICVFKLHIVFWVGILGHPVHRILNLTSKSDSATSNYYVYPFLSTYLNYNTINNVGIGTDKIMLVFYQTAKSLFSILDAIFKPLCLWNRSQRPQIRLYTNFKSSLSVRSIVHFLDTL